MMKMTNADAEAVRNGDSEYILSKGANLYKLKQYDEAAEYYHLAGAMGNDTALSNLGYCYLYGRHTEANTSLALQYFKLAADRGNVDACYKLGDIYSRDKWKMKDPEMSVYYYKTAAELLLGKDWMNEDAVFNCDVLNYYPSLCFALARGFMPEGVFSTYQYLAYQYLQHARRGYSIEIENGADFYEKSLEAVDEMIRDKRFDTMRNDFIDEFIPY